MRKATPPDAQPPKKDNWKPHPHSVVRDKHLSANAYRVWAVIRSHENKDGETELGNDTICREVNLNLKTVQRAKKELASLGLLSVLYKPGKKGNGACKYSTKLGRQKRPSKETVHRSSFSGPIPSPSWERRMILKHTCHGCGWCHECRTIEAKYQEASL